MTTTPLLEARNVSKHFVLGGGAVLAAVDGVSLALHRGETLGLVGESGCGKSTVGRTLAGLYDPTGGEVLFEGKNVTALSSGERQDFTRSTQMIFQDPYASLNPRMTVGDIVAEGLDIYGLCRGKERMHRIYELLSLVGLHKEHANRYPHEFSGGQRQRIGIARSLAVEPRVLVCDEPISALDVSIQAQVVNLLLGLQERFGLTYLFISHDLSMVRYLSNRVAVMYLGSLVETATSDELYATPLHPYTRALLSAIPLPDPEKEATRTRVLLEGDVPSPVNPPPGCRFASRCPEVLPFCTEVRPELRECAPGHFLACHLHGR